MRKFKLTDTWVNIILIIAGIIFVILWSDLPAFLVYFVIGTWQCISMSVHYSKRWFIDESAARRMFHQTVIGVFIVTISAVAIAFFTNSLIFLLIFLMILYVGAPILAITYTCICYNETYIKMRRPLALLK